MRRQRRTRQKITRGIFFLSKFSYLLRFGKNRLSCYCISNAFYIGWTLVQRGWISIFKIVENSLFFSGVILFTQGFPILLVCEWDMRMAFLNNLADNSITAQALILVFSPASGLWCVFALCYLVHFSFWQICPSLFLDDGTIILCRMFIFC